MRFLLLLFLTLPLISSELVTTPYPRLLRAAACAADYEACGTAVLAPVHNLPCCSSAFYCYTRGPYFSQCRPTRELPSNNDKTKQQQPIRKPLCGLDYGVCAAGNAAHSTIKCCSPDFECKPAPPLYWQCLPHHTGTNHHKHHRKEEANNWFRIVPQWFTDHITRHPEAPPSHAVRYSFQPLSWASVTHRHVTIEPVPAMDKVTAILFRNGTACVPDPHLVVAVVAVLPLLHQTDHDQLLARVRDALRHTAAHVIAQPARLVVIKGPMPLDLADVAITLAAFPHVLRVELVREGV